MTEMETIQRPRRRTKPRVAVTYSVRPEQAEQLRQLSEKRDVPISMLVREALDMLFAKEGL